MNSHKKAQKRTKKKSFTLLELLAVIAIIAILAGILLPVLTKAREYAWRARARDTVYQLVTAWKAYLNDNRAFPTNAITEMNTNTMAILNADETYMEFTAQEISVVTNGGVRDPWGELYQVALDNGEGDHDKSGAAYDGLVTPAHTTNNMVMKSVVVWSRGPDGKDDEEAEQRDDVKSW